MAMGSALSLAIRSAVSIGRSDFLFLFNDVPALLFL